MTQELQQKLSEATLLAYKLRVMRQAFVSWISLILLTSISFGVGLIFSFFHPGDDDVMGLRESAFIAFIPGWPLSTGLVVAISGIVSLAGVISLVNGNVNDHEYLSVQNITVVAMWVVSTALMIHGTTYLIGSIELGTFFGPQFWSMGVSVIVLSSIKHVRDLGG